MYADGTHVASEIRNFSTSVASRTNSVLYRFHNGLNRDFCVD
jgi:hypothetical protein